MLPNLSASVLHECQIGFYSIRVKLRLGVVGRVYNRLSSIEITMSTESSTLCNQIGSTSYSEELETK